MTSHRRSFVYLEALCRDFRYALRALARNPSFSGAAVLTLAVGIGANTAVFSVVNALLLQPLPYPDAEQLVRIVENLPTASVANGRQARATGLTDEDVRALTLTATGRPVVDRTGLKGSYQVSMTFDLAAARRGPTVDAAPTAAPSIFTAVQEQLGLKLESTTAPVPVLVIDRLEHPTEN